MGNVSDCKVILERFEKRPLSFNTDFTTLPLNLRRIVLRDRGEASGGGNEGGVLQAYPWGFQNLGYQVDILYSSAAEHSAGKGREASLVD